MTREQRDAREAAIVAACGLLPSDQEAAVVALLEPDASFAEKVAALAKAIESVEEQEQERLAAERFARTGTLTVGYARGPMP